MAYDREIAERIRQALAGQSAVREVAMFGGLSFMVHGKIAVVARNDGDLMVRCDPDRVDDLLADTAAVRAEMKGRPMSKGWVVVGADRIGSADDLHFWLGLALDHNHRATGGRE
jgi:hypothetical protein